MKKGLSDSDFFGNKGFTVLRSYLFSGFLFQYPLLRLFQQKSNNDRTHSFE